MGAHRAKVASALRSRKTGEVGPSRYTSTMSLSPDASSTIANSHSLDETTATPASSTTPTTPASVAGQKRPRSDSSNQNTGDVEGEHISMSTRSKAHTLTSCSARQTSIPRSLDSGLRRGHAPIIPVGTHPRGRIKRGQPCHSLALSRDAHSLGDLLVRMLPQ